MRLTAETTEEKIRTPDDSKGSYLFKTKPRKTTDTEETRATVTYGMCGVLRGRRHRRNLSKRNQHTSPAKCSKPVIKRKWEAAGGTEATWVHENKAEDRGPNRWGATCAISSGAALSSQRSTNPEFHARGNGFQNESKRTTFVDLQISHQQPCPTRTVHGGRW